MLHPQGKKGTHFGLMWSSSSPPQSLKDHSKRISYGRITLKTFQLQTLIASIAVLAACCASPPYYDGFYSVMSVPGLPIALSAAVTPGSGFRWECYCWSSASLVSAIFHGSNKQTLKGCWSSPGHGTSTLGLAPSERKPPSPRDRHSAAAYRLPPPRWMKTLSHPPP